LPDTTVIPSLNGYATEEYVDNAIANSGVIVTATGESIVLTDSSDKPLEGLVLYGKTTQDGTPSPSSPVPLESVGESGAINTTVSGKNLYSGGDVIIPNAYNGYQVLEFPVYAGFPKFTLSFNPNGFVGKLSCLAQLNKYINLDGTESRAKMVITPDHANSTGKLLYNNSGTTVEINITNIQIELGDTATEFEPYKGQTLTVSTPKGLPGIPVTSGGNYTDENGQQYVSDYKDYEREVYVLRCEKIEFYNGETISTPYISATGELTTGAEVIYALATPIETPLPAEEIAAYKALRSNKPVTTILNDGGAGMSVSYVADTKAYIDNKFAELEAAILSTGGNV